MADKVKRTPAKLSKLVEDFDMEIVCRGSDYAQRTVSISDMNRPALQLVGFYDYFEPTSLQVFGKSEMTFLKAMKLEDRRRVFDTLLRCEIPALIIARNMEIFRGLLEIAPARCVLNAALKGRYHHADGKEGPAQLGEDAHH